MDAVPAYSHLAIRIKRCILLNVIVNCTKARVCRRSMGREREVRKTIGSSADDSS